MTLMAMSKLSFDNFDSSAGGLLTESQFFQDLIDSCPRRASEPAGSLIRQFQLNPASQIGLRKCFHWDPIIFQLPHGPNNAILLPSFTDLTAALFCIGANVSMTH